MIRRTFASIAVAIALPFGVAKATVVDGQFLLTVSDAGSTPLSVPFTSRVNIVNPTVENGVPYPPDHPNYGRHWSEDKSLTPGTYTGIRGGVYTLSAPSLPPVPEPNTTVLLGLAALAMLVPRSRMATVAAVHRLQQKGACDGVFPMRPLRPRTTGRRKQDW